MAQDTKFVYLNQGVLFPGALLRIPSDQHNENENENENEKSQVVAVPTNRGKLMGSIGVAARVVRLQNMGFFEGLHRVKLSGNNTVEQIKTDNDLDKSLVEKKLDLLKGRVKRLLDLAGAQGSRVLQQFKQVSGSVNSSGKMVDVLCSVLPFSFEEKVALLDELDLVKRVDKVIALVDKKTAEVENAKNSSVQRPSTNTRMDKNTRKKLLKSQLHSVKEELRKMGAADDDDDGDDDDEDGLKDLKKQLGALKLTHDARKVVNRELRRLERMHPSQADYNVTRTYLETLCDIPWGYSGSNRMTLDAIKRAKATLDEDHYGLEKVKKRLVEYLTVMYLRQQSGVVSSAAERTPILLLVGPPGVGKTSLAKSVASALNRKLHRVSLGGLRDESELKGHRRTYVGAMPGEFTKSLIKTGVDNPVIVLDEIDKLSGATVYGDPTGVMLEVLDPESNNEFYDRYVSFPIDLSKVLFIATANSLDTISAPLLDRMETIHIEGYTYREKEQIASKYLIPRQVQAAGLSQVDISSDIIREIATKYTREAGVRSLNREIGTLCRNKAVEQLDEEREWSSKVSVDQLEHYLGIPKYQDEQVDDQVDEYEKQKGEMGRYESSGVVNGLAYMGSGNGGILKLEVTSMQSGTGKLQLTGSLGDVISESAQISWSWVKANCTRFHLDADALNKVDLHLHAPSGAVPKDGPSAGIAMTIALVSLLTDQIVPRDIAMTGEMTLRGKILPVGGIREKLLGAHLAGIKTVLVPFSCRSQVKESCADLELNVVYVKYIWDALRAVWPGQVYQVDSRL